MNQSVKLRAKCRPQFSKQIANFIQYTFSTIFNLYNQIYVKFVTC